MRCPGLYVVVASAGWLLGCPPVHAPPGDEGAACSDDKPCQSGLTCVDGSCVRIVADAGPSDAVIGDLVGRDLLGMDLARPDATAQDRAVADHASGADLGRPDVTAHDGTRPDTAAVDGTRPDAARVDGAGPPDHGWLPDGVHLPDGWTMPDGWTRPDGWTMPDIAGADLWFLQPDADFSETGVGFDAAVAVYTGTAEDGVVCGGQLCGSSDTCCIAPISTTLYCDSSQPMCGQYELNIECDGPEDCGAGEECCSRNLNTFCIVVRDGSGCYADNSNNVLICVDSGDCSPGFDCCASGALNEAGLDIGWCQRSCD